MKKIISVLLLFTAISFTAKAQQTMDTATITISEAKNHINEPVKLKGKVLSIFLSDKYNGKPTYFNLDDNYPNNQINIIIYESDLKKMNINPVDFKGKNVIIRGTIKQKTSKPYIVLKRREQIEILIPEGQDNKPPILEEKTQPQE